MTCDLRFGNHVIVSGDGFLVVHKARGLGPTIVCLACLACGSGVDNLDTRFAFDGGSREAREAVSSAFEAWRYEVPALGAGIGHPHQATIRIVDKLDENQGLTRFDVAEIVIKDDGDFSRTRRVALHELGHWFSWSEEHSADPRDVMHAPVHVDELTPADVARAK